MFATRSNLGRIAASAFGLLAMTSRLPAAFEQTGAGARPIGMGSAFTAISDDAHAIHYNPAGLGQAQRGEFTGGYGKLFAGFKDSSNLRSGFVGILYPIAFGRYGSLGLGWLSLGLEGAYREDSINLSYGKESFLPGLFLGGTAKLLRRDFGADPEIREDPLFAGNGSAATHFSFDLGILYRPRPSFSIGWAVKDLNEPGVGIAASEKVHREFRGGAAYRERALALAAEIWRKDRDTGVAFGLEKRLFGDFALRAGLGGGSRNRRDLSAGLGYRGASFALDYAFHSSLGGIESTAGSHRLSFTLRFGRPPERARWEFEREPAPFQISELQSQLKILKERAESGDPKDAWAREQIKKIEQKLQARESSEMEDLKARVSRSDLEAERLKQKIRELEQKIQRLSRPAPSLPPPPQKTPVVPRTYAVKEGDTLRSIAEKFYGDPARWVEIYDLNSDRIERGGTLQTGQILFLPER